MTRNSPVPIRRRSTALLLAAGLALAGCASFPEQAAIKQFATATERVAKAGEAAFAANIALAEANAVEDGALAYISGRRDFSTPAINTIPPKQWQLRLAVVKDIADYANELGRVADPAAADQAAASAGNLAGSVIALANSQSKPQPVSPAFAAATPKLVGGLARIGTNAFLAKRMRTVMRRTDPVIAEAVRQLKADYALLVATPHDNAKLLTRRRGSVLALMRADPRANRVALYGAYHDMVERTRVTDARLSVLDGLPEALDKLAKAHTALANSHDQARALKDFTIAAKDLVGIIEAVHSS